MSLDGLAQKVQGSQDLELNTTPEEFANFSPGFPTLGNKSVNILFTLKELRNRVELFQSKELMLAD